MLSNELFAMALIKPCPNALSRRKSAKNAGLHAHKDMKSLQYYAETVLISAAAWRGDGDSPKTHNL
ncbi:MAG: hypothetical protein PXY39_13090 [archaeon]|nr:hypothetical protein [archaeon]